ncbi:uncharacterized protein K452DRAFT_237370 [Aplosporella prunicola CBS 121167]|uniref:Protein kinase domain-containing protein n=1 Tax=Aplosporella prunicola CBS 121167 TaxID=1176127 RepID=A0A6A6B0F5_9PEZI|nr:uncharacterized protein K452DRAFT_237370 [Aplosporella prunicola CBS 121167]KAF2136517.1 hypothetical protein K452DRAFT_237370 [Aplosporella prunicola CBS 121167]
MLRRPSKLRLPFPPALSIHHLSTKSTTTLYTPLEDIEPLERYRPGGYHPVRINDRLHSRYRIVHKLGFGSYSTTWLARDEKAEATSYVALKIAVAQAECTSESRVLRLLRDEDPEGKDAGRAVVPALLDEFTVQGPNGSHQCIVTLPASMSLSDAREASYGRLFQLPVARAIAAQLIQAVAFLHSKGVVHSDLHEGNILLRLPSSVDCLTPDQLYEKYGQPELEAVQRLHGQPLGNGVPDHAVVPIWLGAASQDITPAESAILLTDFGESFQPATTTRHRSHTPLILRAPELFLEPSLPLSFPTDIWALACVVFSVFGQRPLFESWFPSQDEVLQEQIDMLGQLPPGWWASWKTRGNFFDERLERVDGEPRRPWAERFEYSIQVPRRLCGMEEVGDREKAALEDLLLSMLAFKPTHRLDARQVLQSKWMTRWGLPALEWT